MPACRRSCGAARSMCSSSCARCRRRGSCRCSDGSDYPIPSYDRGAMQIEVELLLDWYWPALHGERVPREVRAEFLALWGEVFDRLQQEPPACVLRDFHSPNLLWLPDRAGYRPRRHHRFPGRAARLDRLRPGVAAAGCARRRAGGPGGAAARPLPAARRPRPTRRSTPKRSNSPTPRSVHSEIPRSSAFSCGCHVATARPSIWRTCRASGGIVERNLRNPRLAGLAAWYDRYFPADARTGALPA